MVDLQEVLENVQIPVLLLHLGDGQLLLVGQTLEGPHGRLQRRLGAFLGTALRLGHGRGERTLQLGMARGQLLVLFA